DAPGDASPVRRLRVIALVLTAEERAPVEPAHLAIGDAQVLYRARKTHRVRALDDDRVIPRRVHAAIGNVHVAAGIDVDAVAVGIDLEVVDCEVVQAGGQDAKMPGHEDRDIADDHVAAELERDGLVAAAGRIAAGEALGSIDQTEAGNRDIFQVLAP